jgi:hypothetical protein
MIAMASNGHLDTIVRLKRTGFGAPDALFDADTAPDAKEFGDERDLVGGLHLYTELAYKEHKSYVQSRTRTWSTWARHRPIFTTGHDFVCRGFDQRDVSLAFHPTIGVRTRHVLFCTLAHSA